MAARRQVTRVADVAAAPETVWRALVEPGGLARWLGTARGIRVQEARDGRLVFVYGPAAAASGTGDASLVEITLGSAGAGTRVRVTETALADLLTDCVEGSAGIPVEPSTHRVDEVLVGGARG